MKNKKGNQEIKKDNQEMRFEDYLEKLEKIVQQLEEGELTLDESVKLYQEGMNISQICLKMLDQAKQRVEELVIKGEEEYSVHPFSVNKGENNNNES